MEELLDENELLDSIELEDLELPDDDDTPYFYEVDESTGEKIYF